ncbi:MAG: glycoside hydrolase family 10 protein [Bacteroidota bacterium]
MRSLFFVLIVVMLTGCASGGRFAGDSATPVAPPFEREFRAAWIATVANIDWPSQRGLPVEQQKEELRRQLDRLVELNMNAAVFQVRPAADALYDSPIEPWSEYLTGEEGQAPEPYYDPLAFAIEEAHARGLELHAWFNPFRARHPSARSAPADDHVSRERPQLVREYGTHLWLDPGVPEAREYSLEVVMDVVRRYDVDGVHLDDYFYPYRERDEDGELIEFPDDESYARARAEGETRDRDDWRRHNVDRFVESMYHAVKNEKPHVLVGISPFGIWRPGHPEQIRGFDAYQEIFADARLWLREGWVDYFSPQLYWPIEQREQSYPVLLEWWVGENVHDRHIWPGNFTSRVESGASVSWPVNEIVSQIEHTRRQDGADGNIHFSMRALMEPRGGLAETLATEVYSSRALVPASPWLGEAPAVPAVTIERAEDGHTATITGNAFLWAIQLYDGGAWRSSVLPAATKQIVLSPEAERLEVRAVDRTGQLSEAAVVTL